MTRVVLASALIAGLLVTGVATPVSAAPMAATETAPEVKALVDCRKVTEDAARLACYDKAASSLDQAQAKGDVVVVSREHLQETRRQAFGFHLPALDLFGGKQKTGETIDRLTLQLASAHQLSTGQWVLEATNGAVWRQTDDWELHDDPRPGATLTITSGALGTFFCQVGKMSLIRCKRES